jgi:8-oxo-dGTP pyrophosphatase MutT (NUDIX family)
MYNLTIMQVLKYATLLYYILLSSSNTVVLAFLPYSASRQSLSLFHSSNNEQFLYKKLFYTTSILNKHASNRKRVYSRLTATNLGETTQTTTHISNYIVDIHSTNKENEIWSLYKEDVSGKTKKEQPCMCLYGERMNSNNSIHVKVTQLLTSNGSNTVEDTYFLPVLSRILAQRLLFVTGRLSSTDISTGAVSCATEIRLDLPFFGDISPTASTTTRTITEILPPENHLIGNPFVFFEDLLPNGTMKECELVELVDIQGQALAALPRIFIHNYNMLHRGIGVLVVQPELQLPIHPTFMDLMNTNIYCHQRTWSKRIFPGLYDMFIGGVSAVDEPAYETAKRELEEELGILVNLSSLSPPLFQCTIRTTYNHCIVTVFFYQCASDTHFTVRQSTMQLPPHL